MQYKLITAVAAALVCSPAQADIVSVTASGVLFFGVDPSGIFGDGVNLTGDTFTASITFDTSRNSNTTTTPTSVSLVGGTGVNNGTFDSPVVAPRLRSPATRRISADSLAALCRKRSIRRLSMTPKMRLSSSV